MLLLLLQKRREGEIRVKEGVVEGRILKSDSCQSSDYVAAGKRMIDRGAR